MGPSLGSCRLALDTYARMWGVRSCLKPCGPECECLTIGPCKLLYLGLTGSGVSSCLGPCRLGCESLPKTMWAHGKSLPRTCRLGFETLPKDAAGSDVSPCLRPCALGVNPCLWPLGLGVNPCLGPVGSGGRPFPGPCGLECELLLRTLRARLWVLA